MKEHRLIKKGVIFNYLHLFVGFLWVFLLTPIILKYLGPTKYGYWAILTSVVTYLTLFNFGLNIATAKYTAEYKAKDETGTLNRLISTTFYAMVVLIGIMLLVSLCISPYVPQIFDLEEGLNYTGKIAFLITSFSVGLVLVGGVYGNVIYGLHRVDVWKLLRSVQLFLYALLSIVFLHLGWGLIGVVMALASSHAILVFLYRRFLKKSHVDIVISTKYVSWQELKHIGPYSIRSFILGLTNCLLNYKDYIIIGIFLGAASVTPYEIIFKICFFSSYLYSAFSSTIFPKISELYARGEIDRLRRLYLVVAKLSMMVMTPIALCFLFFGFYFVKLWVGEANYAGYPVLIALVAMSGLHAMGTPTVNVLQGIGKNKLITYSEIINAVINLTLSIILIRKYGLLGVAMATFIASAITSSWVLVYAVCDHLYLSVLEYFRVAIIPPLIVGLFTAGIMLMARNWLPGPDSWFYLAINCAFVILVYMVFFVIFGIKTEERRRYWHFITGRRSFRIFRKVSETAE